jgi:RNA polymerase sigma factor (sigma-70 family)
VVTGDLMSRARAGDGDAFRELTEPYRRELLVHCYRMLGSFQDAEDALQDTLLGAWQGLEAFSGRAAIRTWLYRIATNRCLNARRSASRRPAREWDVPHVEPPEPTRLGEVVWLEPYPDAQLEGAIDAPPGPEARYEQTESISLAFVTALQILPPRQSADLDALVALLTDDVFMSMPPVPFEYEGQDVVTRFCAGIFRAGRRFDLVPTRANGQPAFGAYLRARGGISHGTGLYVLTLTGDQICAMTRFDNSVLPWFGLPRSLPSR